mmetsp:Transcript_28976/g.81615  ORF Transcript_28976/g.81615 Transcript_28976/m.81615 type:complete len:421 (-) Transcript_28976:224-1486(-)|eukprot:CAMPEP_0117673504 /NCGR_PEP_ID=MMETSP0804-20121206/14510_1 /TAXON_ID=1074897 /ORGANISM="Tetraselmis astigmatica, Strain CCMP880" /LENGTH=420 /DNA_ID=CAMNT_0005482251 /DNA_START=89 /DNA_END=1351 /DNA_ORIENTATION=-
MTTKEEKPTLGGVTIKTRKRNIAVPLDPASFANAVIAIFEDAEGETVAEILSAGCKVLETSTLDFSRYGTTLFEVLFAGGRMTAGGSLEESEFYLKQNILKQNAVTEEIMPFINTFQQLIRRRPFLIKSLETTMCKFLKTLEFFDSADKKKVAMTCAMVFSNKLGVLPEEIFESLENDRMIAKGTVAEFLTEFLREYLAKCSMAELVLLLKKAKMDKRLIDFFPAEKRTPEQFNQHFEDANLPAIVEYAKDQFASEMKKELQELLMAAISQEQPVAEVTKMVKDKQAASTLSDTDTMKVVWSSLMETLSLTGKNHQQVQFMVLKQVKVWSKLLGAVATSARVEAALMVEIQVSCYEDSQKLKLFSDIIRLLYDNDVIAEDTIHYWQKKGSAAKGRNVFMKDMEPFLKWLDEADEEEDDED